MSEEQFVSKLDNCYVAAREGEGPIISVRHGDVIVSLDRYAIIPMEEYRKLKERMSEAELNLDALTATINEVF